jgi:hypothetical protein
MAITKVKKSSQQGISIPYTIDGMHLHVSPPALIIDKTKVVRANPHKPRGAGFANDGEYCRAGA